jgi:hypothetical protein
MREPLLILDSRERWRPVPVEALAEAGATVGAGGKVVDVDHLPESGGRIDLPPDADQPWNANWVGYWRNAGPGGGLTWFQFWTFWLYNPKTYAGVGAHEGDWELVQLGCKDDAGDWPILMSCSQHDGGEKREFWRVTLDEKRPVVYVARDSHANYFAPERDVTDVADGLGERLELIEWREFGPWASWPGQWGNSRNSPGPLSSRRAWLSPHAWHGQARG